MSAKRKVYLPSDFDGINFHNICHPGEVLGYAISLFQSRIGLENDCIWRSDDIGLNCYNLKHFLLSQSKSLPLPKHAELKRKLEDFYERRVFAGKDDINYCLDAIGLLSGLCLALGNCLERIFNKEFYIDLGDGRKICLSLEEWQIMASGLLRVLEPHQLGTTLDAADEANSSWAGKEQKKKVAFFLRQLPLEMTRRRSGHTQPTWIDRHFSDAKEEIQRLVALEDMQSRTAQTRNRIDEESEKLLTQLSQIERNLTASFERAQSCLHTALAAIERKPHLQSAGIPIQDPFDFLEYLFFGSTGPIYQR